MFKFKLEFRLLVIILPVIFQIGYSSSLPKLPKEYPPMGSEMRKEFLLDPNYTPLNHGAYGTYPKTVQAALRTFQERIENNPDYWIRIDARIELDKVRAKIAQLLGCDAEDLVAVPNTTSGINAVLRSMIWQPGDKIMHFSTVYGAMKSLIDYVTDTFNGTVTSIEFPVTYPISNEKLVEQFEAFVSAMHRPNEKSPIRLALFDHITSVPHVINPLDKFIPYLKSLGILVLIDGAHAVGQVEINLRAMNPDYYITNAHKWLYAYRSAAVLYVAKNRQASVHPAIISSNYDHDGSRFQDEFFWTGTIDYSPYMTIPAAIDFRQAIGGEQKIMHYTNQLAKLGGEHLRKQFGTEILQDDNQMGSCVDVKLPIDDPENELITVRPGFWDTELFKRELFTGTYKHNGVWWIRVSTQVYNDIADFEKAGNVYKEICDMLNQHTRDKSGSIGKKSGLALQGGVVALGYLKSHADL